jgi:hypothetical protein
VGPTCRRRFPPHARLISLSRGPHSSARLPIRSPALSVPWAPPVRALCHGHTHDRAFPGHARLARTFSGARTHSLALPRSVAPWAEHPRPLSRSARASVKLAVVCRPFCGRRWVFAAPIASVNSAPSPATWDTSWFAPSSSGSSCPLLRAYLLGSWSSAAVDPRPPYVPVVAQVLQSLHSRWTTPPRLYFPVCCPVFRTIARWSGSTPPLGGSAADCALWCPHAGTVPVVESVVSHRVRPEPFPCALDLRRGGALASGETSPRRRAAPPRVGQPPSPSPPSDLMHPSGIWRSSFYLTWPDLSRPFWIWPLRCVPSVAPLQLGPTSQPCVRSLTPPGPPVSARRASPRALALGSNLGVDHASDG